MERIEGKDGAVHFRFSPKEVEHAKRMAEDLRCTHQSVLEAWAKAASGTPGWAIELDYLEDRVPPAPEDSR